MMTVIEGQDLIEHVLEYDVVLVGASIKNVRGNGLHRKICLNFPEVLEAELETGYDDQRKLGTIVKAHENPIFCSCFITRGRFRPDKCPDTLDYESLRKCLKSVRKEFKDKKIAMPLLGSSEYDGSGDRSKIQAIIEDEIGDMTVCLFDYEQRDYMAENAQKWHDILDKVGDISTEEYRDLKNRFLWEEYLGIYEPYPEGLKNKEIRKLLKEKRNERKSWQ